MMPFKTIAIAVLVAVFAAACKRDQSEDLIGPESIHPTVKNIPSVTDPRYVRLRQRDQEQPFIDLSRLPSRTIGALDGAPHHMIGSIRDLAPDYQGGVLVLDAPFQSSIREVRVYDAQDSLIAIVGSAGEGPGEFRLPTALGIARGGQSLLVRDDRRVHVFHRSDGTFRFHTSFEATGHTDLCALNEHVYLLGHSEERDAVIHKYTLEGEYVSSFGEAYDDPNPFARMVMSDEGMLVCNARHGVIGRILQRIPALAAYSTAGEDQWRVHFTDFAPQTFTLKGSTTEDNGVAMTMTYDQSPGKSLFTSAFEDDPDYFVLQYSTESDSSDAIRRRHHLFRVYAATGEGTYLGWTTQSVLGVDANHVFARSRSQFPQIAIYDRIKVFRQLQAR